jgi:ketosteroid isomerase-like protein
MEIGMAASDNKQLIRDFYAAGARGDMETCFALLADGIRWTNIGSTRFSGTYTGKQDLADNLLGPLFGLLKNGIASQMERLIAEDDIVVAQTSGIAETLDGQPYNNSYCQVFRIQEGVIVEVKEYFDTELVTSVFGPAQTVN